MHIQTKKNQYMNTFKTNPTCVSIAILFSIIQPNLTADPTGAFEELAKNLIGKQFESGLESLTKPIKSWIFGTEYTGAVNISSSRFNCTIVEPYDTNRGYTITEIKRTTNTDSRGIIFYNSLTIKTTYQNDGKIISSEETKSTDSFALYIENYVYDCQSSKNNSTEIKSSTDCTATMTIAGPSLKSTENPAFKFDLQSSVKTVPKGCISNKEYSEWSEAPEYLKTQTVIVTSIINSPLRLSKQFTPDLNQEIVSNTSYRWTKVR